MLMNHSQGITTASLRSFATETFFDGINCDPNPFMPYGYLLSYLVVVPYSKLNGTAVFLTF